MLTNLRRGQERHVNYEIYPRLYYFPSTILEILTPATCVCQVWPGQLWSLVTSSGLPGSGRVVFYF